jgi:signal transduction histidine kinase
MGFVAGQAWPWTAYAALMAVAVCSSWRRPRLAWLVAAVAVAEPMIAIWSRGKMMTPGGSVEFGLFGTGTGELVFTATFYVIATILVMLLPVLMRREAERERDLRDLLRGRREVQREATVLDERSRLARDLHDVVAHHVSLIAVRAETAPYTCADLSPDARAAFAEIAEESRLALRELRGVLGVLRRIGDAAPRTPQPTAASIERLVLDARSTTATVSASLRDLEAVAPTPGYVAYRVVQEALTNARRHAPDAVVDVAAHGDGAGGISVRVTNSVAEVDTVWEHGQGITGMTERVAAAGGHLGVGPRDGLFVVEARLPESSSPEPDQAGGDDA